MEYEETVSDLETFGISLTDEKAFGICKLLYKEFSGQSCFSEICD